MRPFLMTLIATLLFSTAASALDHEKCYGISKIGENDGWLRNINPGKYKAKHDYDGRAWKFVPVGKCESYGGSLKSFIGPNPFPDVAITNNRKPKLRYEKCYGISKKGLNDGWGKNINPGKYKAKHDYHGMAWKFVHTGKCVQMGGSLTPFKGYTKVGSIHRDSELSHEIQLGGH